MKESVVRKKSFEFAIDIVNTYKKLAMEKREFVMSKQLLKAGTSIGANVREASNGESTADFIHKLAIAQKEADETLYWLELLNETHFINREEFSLLSHSCEELLKITRYMACKCSPKPFASLRASHSPKAKYETIV